MNNKFKTQSIFDNTIKSLKRHYGSITDLDEVLMENDQKAEIILFKETLNLLLVKNPAIFDYVTSNIDILSFLTKLVLFYMETDHYELYNKPFCGRQFVKDSRDWKNDLKILHLPIAVSKYSTRRPLGTGYFNLNVNKDNLLFEQFISSDVIRYIDEIIFRYGKNIMKKEFKLYVHMRTEPYYSYKSDDMRDYFGNYDHKEIKKKFNMIAKMRKMFTKKGIINLVDTYRYDSVYGNAIDGETIIIKNATNRTKDESIKSLL